MYNLNEHYKTWPKYLRDAFRGEVVDASGMAAYSAFYNWLSKGVPANSKCLTRLVELVEKYNTLNAEYLAMKQNRKALLASVI